MLLHSLGTLFTFSLIFQLSATMFPGKDEGPLPSSAATTMKEKGKPGAVKKVVHGLKRIGGGFKDFSTAFFYRYDTITASVELDSVRLVQWDEAKKNNEHHCDAEIVDRFYFRINRDESTCDWIKRIDWEKYDKHPNLSLDVQYKADTVLYVNSNYTKKVRYDFWSTRQFPPANVKLWLKEGKGHFRLDHNNFPSSIFYKYKGKLEEKEDEGDGLCYAKPFYKPPSVL